MCDKIVEIDGSLLEGGGQILRIALTLSALCKVPIHVNNIRAGRSKPGLMAQHLKGIHLIRDITQGKLEGDFLGSTEIKFWPNEIIGGQFSADTRTAGSVTLLLQVALPCILFANSPTSLTLCGGTNTDMAPQVDYITEIFRPNLEKFGSSFDFDLVKRGYFPKGGGVIKINVKPVKKLKSVQLLDQGNIKSIYGWSFVAGTLPMHIAQTSADAAVRVFKQNFPDVKIDVERYKEDNHIAPHNCSGLILVGETSSGCILGSTSLGQRNIQAEEAGKKTATDLSEVLKSGACVDQHCQDQLIVFMALADGKSQIRVDKITMHTETAIFVTEKMTKAKFEIIPDGSSTILSCDGIGFDNINLN